MIVADIVLSVHGWTWEYVEETLTPSRLRAFRKVTKSVSEGPTPTQSGPPPMNAKELVKWIDATEGKIDGVGRR